jgi:hypothetical protein
VVAAAFELQEPWKRESDTILEEGEVGPRSLAHLDACGGSEKKRDEGTTKDLTY